MGLYKLAMGKETSFKKMIALAEQKMNKEFAVSPLSGRKKKVAFDGESADDSPEYNKEAFLQVTEDDGQGGLTEIDIAIRKSIEMLKTTPFEALLKNFESLEMRRLFMFAFELCLTNDAPEMTAKLSTSRCSSTIGSTSRLSILTS